MVGRLVEDQQVDFLIHEHAQPQTALLAAGEVSDGFEHILTGEHKLSQTVTGDLRRHVLFIEHGVVKAALGMVKVDDLGQVSPFHRGTELDLAGEILIAQQALDEGGLAGAVVAQQRDALAALHGQINPGEQGAVAEGLGHILGLEDDVAGEILLPEGRLHGPLGLGTLGLLDALHAVLDGHGAAVEGAVVDAPALHALHRVAQLLQLRLLLLIVLHLQVETSLLFIHVEGVVAGIELTVTVHDLDDPLSHLIQEVAVMGNGQDGALEGLDVGFQPLHAVQVQMVGRLVQQKDVGLFQQQTSQVDAGLLAAGEGVEFLLALVGGDGQTVADLVHFYVHLVAAACSEPGNQIVILLQLLLRGAVHHGKLQDLHLPLCRQNVRVGRAQNILDGVAIGELGDLGDQTQPLGGIDVYLAVVIIHLTGEDLEQSGLAAAVTTQNGNTLALLDLKGQILQQILADGKEFCQVFNLNIYHGISPLSYPQGIDDLRQFLRAVKQVHSLQKCVGTHFLRETQVPDQGGTAVGAAGTVKPQLHHIRLGNVPGFDSAVLKGSARPAEGFQDHIPLHAFHAQLAFLARSSLAALFSEDVGGVGMLQVLIGDRRLDVVTDDKARTVGIGENDQSPELCRLAKQCHLLLIFENSKSRCLQNGGVDDL